MNSVRCTSSNVSQSIKYNIVGSICIETMFIQAFSKVLSLLGTLRAIISVYKMSVVEMRCAFTVEEFRLRSTHRINSSKSRNFEKLKCRRVWCHHCYSCIRALRTTYFSSDRFDHKYHSKKKRCCCW